MTEAKPFNQHEIESMYVAQWGRYMVDPTHASKSFHELKAWLGPKLWSVLVTLPFTNEQMDHVLNVLPRAMWHPNQTPEKILAAAVAAGCAQWSKLDEHTNVAAEVPQLKREGNVIRASFGNRNEKTHSSG